MNIIEVNSFTEVPENFTGIIEHKAMKAKFWYKERKWHREDGPAVEIDNGNKEWWISSMPYNVTTLERYYKKYIFLGKEKGIHNLDWLKFLTENEGIIEFPYIKGMEESRDASQELKLFLIDLFKT